MLKVGPKPDGTGSRDVTVVPVACEPADHRGTLRQILNSVIEGTGVVMHRSEASEMFAPPEAVLIALARTSDEHETGFDLRRKVGSVVHAARLLHAGTSQSMYEVSGETSFVRRSSPVLHVFDGHTGLMSWTQQVRRDVVLMPGDPARIAGIEDLIRSADRPRPDVSIQSFALATGRFEGSFQAVNPYDQVVDLMTALEGAMGGANANEVLLRLRTRCAALLAAANDPAAAIFEDIGTLYKLRSTLVHGGEMKAKELTKLLRKVSGAVDGVSFLEAFGYAVDRLRDLVRRSLLVRICLGSGQDPVWPIDSDEGIDSGLSDDATRVMWRTAWHDKLRSIDAEAAALRPAVADSYLATFGKNPPTSLPR